MGYRDYGAAWRFWGRGLMLAAIYEFFIGAMAWLQGVLTWALFPDGSPTLPLLTEAEEGVHSVSVWVMGCIGDALGGDTLVFIVFTGLASAAAFLAIWMVARWIVGFLH